MNYYLTSQLIADRQASVAAGVTHRARLRDARAARKASAAVAARPARPARAGTRWLLFGRLAHAGA